MSIGCGCKAGDNCAPHIARARVFLLSDVRLYRDGLLWSLLRRDVFDLIGASDLSHESIARIAGLKPDAVILDMGGPKGFDIAKRLTEDMRNIKIIAFAVSETENLVLACAEVGVAGYVTPDGTEEDLTNAVQRALRGELTCSPRIAGLLFQRIGAMSFKAGRQFQPSSLTLREQQILDLICEGKSNKEIARALRISYATVKNHVHNILEKLQVRRRGEAAARLHTMRSPDRSRRLAG